MSDVLSLRQSLGQLPVGLRMNVSRLVDYILLAGQPTPIERLALDLASELVVALADNAALRDRAERLSEDVVRYQHALYKALFTGDLRAEVSHDGRFAVLPPEVKP